MGHLEFLKYRVEEFEISGVNSFSIEKKVHYCNCVVFHYIWMVKFVLTVDHYLILFKA